MLEQLWRIRRWCGFWQGGANISNCMRNFKAVCQVINGNDNWLHLVLEYIQGLAKNNKDFLIRKLFLEICHLHGHLTSTCLFLSSFRCQLCCWELTELVTLWCSASTEILVLLQNAVTRLSTINFSFTGHWCYPFLHYVWLSIKLWPLLLKSIGHASTGYVSLYLQTLPVCITLTFYSHKSPCFL